VVGAQVQIVSPEGLIATVRGQTGLDGRYDLYLPLKEGLFPAR